MNKVLVGMSGGIDSSVAALLLKEQGYEVIGVTMNIWQGEDFVNDEINEAKKVAEKLNIPYYNIDIREYFKKEIIDKFASEYMNGRTPNPCILCNKKIKFGKMLEKAQTLFGAEYIATGHYAKVCKDEKTGRFFLKESDSVNRDQTYALYSLSQEQLSHIIFPLGVYTKTQVREIATKNNLDNANREESQEICFVKDNDHAKFIETNYKYKSKVGNFVDIKGKILGQHKGIINYTIGQRRGTGIALKKPVYVYKIDKDNNNVVLGFEDEIQIDTLICTNVNFMPFEKLENKMQVTAKTRYLAPKAKATIYPMEDGNVKVIFEVSQKSITPGQAVVFYDKDIVLGGGIIK